MTPRRQEDDAFAKARAICLALPDTEELIKWGKPHFCVKGKIFAGYGDSKDHGTTMGFKLPMDVAEASVAERAHFHKAPYVGNKGWVSVEVASIDDWDEIAAMVLESYRLIAPKRSLAKLE